VRIVMDKVTKFNIVIWGATLILGGFVIQKMVEATNAAILHPLLPVTLDQFLPAIIVILVCGFIVFWINHLYGRSGVVG
jgi:hypothetical protein